MKKPVINIKQLVKSYFTFTKQERRALLSLFIGIVLLAMAPSVYRFFAVPELQKATPVSISSVQELALLDSGERAPNANADFGSYSAPEKRAGSYESRSRERFFFDPNTASADTWQRLGVSNKTAHSIQKYIDKGGRFKRPADLNRIYTLPKNLAQELMPYVQIASVNQPEKPNYKTESAGPGMIAKSEKAPRPLAGIANINTADTNSWIALPGIGSKLASRIVNYRDKLGGFYSINQIAETYGLPDSTFQLIKPRLTLPEGATMRTININTADAKSLKHPYLSWNQANAIVAYRNQRGQFSSLNDLKKIMVIDEATLERIKPYLALE
ncbi:MAG: hypothetical protein EAY75_07975 [Bacteroidetes bacterium]|nr:MAG: hypothetical protein EAY75_07975 [Bacteroidota bacterium]